MVNPRPNSSNGQSNTPKTMPGSTNVLVDTCVLLDDPEVLERIQRKNGFAFLTSTVLDELDFNKSGSSSANRNARAIFSELKDEAALQLLTLPTGGALQGRDILKRFAFRGGAVHVLARDEFRSTSNNDAKIIELAKDYGMVLITRDNGMKVRAEALGVKVAFWTGPTGPSGKRSPHVRTVKPIQIRQATGGSSSHTAQVAIKPFAIHLTPIDTPDLAISVSSLPGANDVVRLSSGASIRLGALISSGGEGTIYATERANTVCKIYHAVRLTRLKQEKIELMVSRRIKRPGICWPLETVANASGEFVGYLMPLARGQTMQSAMFVKPKLEKTFPAWTRRDLVNIAGTFIDHVAFLHQHNIIVGDINPMNLLVTDNSEEVWMVDTDSFQIEGFPCPVGTVNFTPAEIQGRNYAEFLRTEDHELFAVATMVFMVLFPGKPPYSQQGGGSPADNIKSKNFPYRFSSKSGHAMPEVSGKDAPEGPWQYIWSHLPLSVRGAFFRTFREDKRTSLDEWAELLLGYRDWIDRGKSSTDLFPRGFPIWDPVPAKCAKCSSSFTASRPYVEKLTATGRPLWCPDCFKRWKLERLAQQSHRATEQVGARPPLQRHRPTLNTTRATAPSAPPRAPHRPTQRPVTSVTATTSLLGNIFSIVRTLFK